MADGAGIAKSTKSRSLNATKKGCAYCDRQGLPILPLRFSYCHTSSGPLEGITNASGTLTSASMVATPLVGGYTQYRVLSGGFVYVYDERETEGWRCFAVSADGYLREYPMEQRPAGEVTFQCTLNPGDKYRAATINIRKPREAGKVWLAYSRVWWTKDVRERYMDPGKRSKRMQVVDVSALLGGHPPEFAFPIDASGKALVDHVGEYAGFAEYFDDTLTPGVNRAHMEAPQAQSMDDVMPGKGMAVVLSDAVGMLQDINHWRNAKTGELNDYLDKVKTFRELVVADLIAGLHKQLQDAGKLDEWPRYAKHVDMSRVNKIRKDDIEKRTALNKPIEDAAYDWSVWFLSPYLWETFKSYDFSDREIALALEADMEACVHGSGVLPREQDAWANVLAAPPDSDQYGGLWLALAAGDKSLVGFLKEKHSKVIKGAKSLQKAYKEFKEWLTKRRQQGGMVGTAEATGSLALTLASQITRLAITKPELAQVLGMRLRIVAAARQDIVITPYIYRESMQTVVVAMEEAAWGPPTASMSARMIETRKIKIVQSMEGGGWIGTQIKAEAMMEVEMWLPEEAVKDITAQAKVVEPLALPQPTPSPYTGTLKWLKTFEGKTAAVMAVFSVVNLADSLREISDANHEHDSPGMRKAMFSATTGALALTAATLGIAKSVQKARIVKALVSAENKRLYMSVGRLALIGGAFATVASFAEGIKLWGKHNDLNRQGDTDAASFYRDASLLFIVSAAAGAATTMLEVGAAFAAADVTAASGGIAGAIVGATSGGTILLGIPVWGWIVLGVVALAAGLYFLFRGDKEEDTPLEVWLSRCCLRDEAKYASTELKLYGGYAEEMAGFNQAIYGLRIVLDWKSEPGRDRLVLQAILPGYNEQSDYAYQLLLQGNKPDTVVADQTSAFSSDPDLKPRPPAQTYVSASPEKSWSEKTLDGLEGWLPQGSEAQKALHKARNRQPVEFVGDDFDPAVRFTQHQGYAELKTEVLVDEDWWSKARLKFEYWPDVAHHPEMKMLPVAGGANFQWVKDKGWLF